MKRSIIILLITLTLTAIVSADYSTPSFVWDFENTSIQEVISGNTGTNNGATVNTSGINNNALQYNGVNQDSDTGIKHADAFTNTTDFSISYWFNTPNTGTQSQWGEKGNVAWYGHNYMNLGTGQIGVYAWDGAAAISSYKYCPHLTTETWNHIVLTYDGTNDNMSVYCNGHHNGTITGFDIDYTGVTEEITFGSRRGATWYQGTLDEFYSYHEVLTQTDVDALYNNQTGNFHPFAPPAPTDDDNITINSPSNNSYVQNNNNTINFTVYSPNQTALNCSIYIDEVVSTTANATNNTATSVYVDIPRNQHTLQVNCSNTSVVESPIYNITVLNSTPTISYFNITPDPIYTNNNSNVSTTVNQTFGSLEANLSCYVNGSIVDHTNDVVLTNNTLTYLYGMASGNYSRGDLIFCNATIVDQAGNSIDANDTLTVSDSPPTIPTELNVTNSFYYALQSIFSAGGSTDEDNDTITYHYQVVNNNDGTMQSYSSTNTYTPILADVGDNLTISAIATTTHGNSSPITFEEVVYLTLANFSFFREKTGLPFNISAADEVSVSIICSDDVDTTIITNSTTGINISCPYEFIKTDVTYNETSYFRIINPSFVTFSNISIYLLDLRYDTAVEIILTINDLTGEYSDGEILIERYINSTEVTIISQPLDIESAATLFLLKDALYTVSTINNEGSERVVGNLIASEAGDKILTLPDIDYIPSDAKFGETLFWNYSYNAPTDDFIMLTYLDTNNETYNTTFIITNSTGDVIYSSTSTSNDVTFTYTIPSAEVNNTFFGNLTIFHSVVGELSEQRVFYPGMVVLTEEDSSNVLSGIGNVLFWLSLVILFVIGLSFDAKNSKIGLLFVTIFLIAFMKWKFISFGTIDSILVGFVTVMVILNTINKSRRETG